MKPNVFSTLRTFSCVGATLTLPLIAHQAQGEILPYSPPPQGEATHAEIFSETYGGSFVASGNDFTNGQITATRIDDDTDQIWTPGDYQFKALASFASFTQSFGVMNDQDTMELFDVTGPRNSTQVQGEAQLQSLSNLRLVRVGEKGVQASTLDSDNPGSKNQAITYRITLSEDDSINPQTFAVFFEDIALADSDRDYNDLVVQVNVMSLATTPVPEPASLALFALGGLAIMIRRRR